MTRARAMVIPANTRTHSWTAPHGPGSFKPNGKIIAVGNCDAALRNPEGWGTTDPVLAARIFVGFNVGGAPRWSMDDLVPIVEEQRRAQNESPDSSFVAQKGIYTSKIDGSTVQEDGAQIIILNLGGATQATFKKEILQLAEVIADELEQEEVVVEIQKGGVTQETFGVVP